MRNESVGDTRVRNTVSYGIRECENFFKHIHIGRTETGVYAKKIYCRMHVAIHVVSAPFVMCACTSMWS